jgi:hypothetical protein
MRPRTLLILLVIVLGLGAFIWFYERELPSSEERAELEKRVFADLEKEDVTAVTLWGAKGTVRLERVEAPEPAAKEETEDGEEGEETGDGMADAEWRIVQPLQARADSFAVDRLLESLVTLEKTRTIEDADRKAVGLDRPRATARLATEEGEKVLEIGAGVPTGGSLIAGLAGRDDAYVVSDSILLELDKEPGEWRDRTIFRGDRDEVSRITLAGANGRTVLTSRPDGFWIESPIQDRADRNLVDGLLADLTGLTAERFVDDPRPLVELGLAPPRQVVEVAREGQAPLRIELGAPASTGEASPESEMGGALTYARAAGAVFETRTRLAESANRPPADWRALGLSGLAVHDVESATVKEGNATIELTRAGTDWRRGDTTISYLPVSDLLFALTDARAERLLPPAEAKALKLADPALTVTLKAKESGEETLTLYPATPQGVPARAGGRDVVLLLSADALQQLRQKVKDVREAKAVEEAK